MWSLQVKTIQWQGTERWLQVQTNQWQGKERWLQVQTNQQAGTTFTTATRCLQESTMLPWSRKVQPPSMNNKDTATYTVRPAWQQRWRQSHMPSIGLLRRWLSHMPPSLSHLRSLLQKAIMKWESQNGICQCSTSTSENCGCTALDVSEWREMTEQTAWHQSNHHK